MTESSIRRNLREPRSPGMPEVPRTTALMIMPEIAIGSERIRLTIHSDNIGLMLRFFGTLPFELREAIDVEGRHITDKETAKRLKDNPIHKFYRDARAARTVQSLVFIAQEEAGIDLPQEQLVQLIRSPYSPAALQTEVGYDMQWYNAAAMVHLTEEDRVPYTIFQPQFSGANELRLSSPTLSPEALAKVALDLQEYIKANTNSLTPANIATTIRLADDIIARYLARKAAQATNP